MGKIDVNRGVVVQRHRASGIQVFMYIDNPGVYYDKHANVLPEKIAKEAGYSTYDLAKKRMLKERMAAAYDKIAAELEFADGADKKVLKERNGFKLVEETLGRASIQDDEGHSLMDAPKALAEAQIIFDTLAGEEDDSPKGAPDKTKEKAPVAKK